MKRRLLKGSVILARVCGIAYGLILVCAFRVYAQAPPGPLASQHEMLSGPGNCTNCHSLGTGKREFRCLSCHDGIKADQKSGRHPSLGDNESAITSNVCASCHSLHIKAGAPDKAGSGSPHGPIKIACGNCHTSTGYKPIRPFPEFKHSETAYPLRGMHAGVDCRQCHTSTVFARVGKQCADCHADFHRRQMGSNCEQCHTTRGWRVSLTAVKNHTNRFPLLGAHATADCQSCHRNGAAGAYRGLDTECSSCHQRDYAAAKSPDHQSAKLSTACQSCHTGMDTWRGARLDHSRYGFPLTGGHAQLDCAACHATRGFAGMSSDCAACHRSNYLQTSNPNHAAAGFPQNCLNCHTTAGWTGAKFDHSASTTFPLTGSHMTLDCRACHADGQFSGTSKTCYSCHSSDYNSAKNPVHSGGVFPTDCTGCHTTAGWSGGKFDHNVSAFRLTGAHSNVQCAACHKNGVYTGLSANCVSCHLTDYSGVKDPNHTQSGFPQQCTTCHNTASWTGAAFNHSAAPFPLTGAHSSVQCATCHKNGVYAGLSTNCVSCHLSDYNGVKDPNHAQSGFSQQCTTCHNTNSWTGATFNHGTTPFPLTGAHSSVQCATCHKNGVYTGLSTNCVSCHLSDYNGVKDPNHAQAGFSQQCTTCHNSASWTGAIFNHSTTAFPLAGAHTSVQCSACHKNGVYAGLSANCVSCHLSDYNGAKDPNHAQSGFPQQCTTCHNTNSWTGSTFNHSTTPFPLVGAHTSLQCATCHKNGVYAGLPTTCVSCHLGDYNGATNPNHAQAGFSQQCTTCHNSASWTGAIFNHSTTAFPLVGAHTSVQCATCHKSGVYAGLSTTCVSCHLGDYNGATNPNHVQAGFPQQCTTCHNSSSWTGATFNHSATAFPLAGAHTSVQCATCHKNGVYAGLSTTCVSCHLADYNGTASPNHVQSGFPQDCALCHSTTSFAGAVFDHSKTAFPLTGAHVSASCTTCHKNNVYAGLPKDCVSCHLSNYNATTNPSHVQAGFPQQCSTCHNTTSWAGAVFNHSTTPFPLTGAHTSVQCSLCHINNKFAGTPTDCYSCHSAEYKSTTNPGHSAAGFPTTCATCHTTTSWAGATFNHTWWRTSHGGAKTCSDCHTNSSDYSVFTCTTCHTKAQTDSKHVGRSGYVYNSANCYQCHRSGG